MTSINTILALVGSAAVGAIVTLLVQRSGDYFTRLGKELAILRRARASLQMLLSSVENTSYLFPDDGYDRAAFDRTFALFLGEDVAAIVDRFDEKFYWRLGDIEQHMALVNRLVGRYERFRDRYVGNAQQLNGLIEELRRLHGDCRKELYEILAFVEALPKRARYAPYRAYGSGSAEEWLEDDEPVE